MPILHSLYLPDNMRYNTLELQLIPILIKRSKMSDDLCAFLSLVNALGSPGRYIVPDGDAADMQNGATHIPSRVTDARRACQEVSFTQAGARKNWYWTLPGGEKIYHGED